MAAAVQTIGSTYDAGTSHTVLTLSVSKTVTLGNRIIVTGAYLATAGTVSVTDNLGNTYSTDASYTTPATPMVIFSAPVTVGGTITTITFNHPASSYNTMIAEEYSGVGALSSATAGATGTGTTETWMSSQTIPANGIAVGVITTGTYSAFVAGAASGTPSTSINVDALNSAGGGAGIPMGLASAPAGSSQVTGFTGTVPNTSDTWYVVGAIYAAPFFLPYRSPLIQLVPQ